MSVDFVLMILSAACCVAVFVIGKACLKEWDRAEYWRAEAERWRTLYLGSRNSRRSKDSADWWKDEPSDP